MDLAVDDIDTNTLFIFFKLFYINLKSPESQQKCSI